MSALDRTTLVQAFQNGDRPQGSDYEDLIDSNLNLADTSVQTVQGLVVFSGGFSAATITGANLALTGSVTADTIFATSLNATTVSAQSANLGAVTLSALTIPPTSGLTVAGPVFWTTFGPNSSVDSSVACTGTTQSSAKLLGAYFNVLKTVVTAATDAVRLFGFHPGALFTVVNDTTQSAQLFPPSGAQFDAVGVNGAISVGPRGGGIGRALVFCITSTQAYVLRAS